MIKDICMDLLYPRRCALCDAVVPFGGGLICGKHKALPYVTGPLCMKCGKEVDTEEQELCYDCERHVRNFDRGFPVFNYEEPVKASVLAIKYHNKREYCDFYGREMAEKVRPYVGRYRMDGIAYDILIRKEYTSPQKTLDNIQRANNIKESMTIGRLYPGHNNILLIDDIYTTGVTIDVCAGLLRKAGAQHVYYSTVCVGKGR